MASLKRPPKKQVDEAREAVETVRADWMRRPGVTAVDVGFKITDGQPVETVALRVHVERKIPVAELPESEVLNDTDKADEEVGGFPVDVIEGTYGPSAPPIALDHSREDVVEAVNRRRAVSPLIGGVSCGNARVTAGTIGAIVFDIETCKPMILSNWHVLAGSSSAVAGEAITQPGRLDGGTATDGVATLTRMELGPRMDAAVATLDGGRPHTRDILGIGTVTGTEDAVLGMNVVKSGRTTGLTEGVVDGVAMSTRIDYGDPGVVRFNDQIRIVPRPPWPQVDVEISRGGDSGSVWLNESTNKAVGLHFAGETDPNPASENAICSPIEPVMDVLGFSFFPVVCDPVVAPAPPPLDPLLALLCRRFPFLCGGGLFGGLGPQAMGSSGSAAPSGDVALATLLAALAGDRGGCCRCCSGRAGGDYADADVEQIIRSLTRR